MRHSKRFIALSALAFAAQMTGLAQDPGWPRQLTTSGGKLVLYQPQVDQWTDFTNITWREAFQLTPTGGKQVVGAMSFQATTSVDHETRMVVAYNINVLNTYFPSLPPSESTNMDVLVRTFLPPYVNISLDRVVACLPKPQDVKTVELNNDPPRIFVANSPAILLGIDGEPVLADLPDTKLQSVVNTTWPLFLDKSNSQYYLLVNNIWLTAGSLTGSWSRTMKLPGDFKKLPDSGKFADVKKAYPPPVVANPIIPGVFYSTTPSEVILFSGPPAYTPIPPTQLQFASNTDSPVFFYGTTQTYYYLVAGRWFSAASLDGPWTFATNNLPPDFANIPLSSPASAIRSSVPGTNEAKDAVLIAQIPTTMILNPATAAAQVNVTYSGAPQFTPITGTTLQYATNTVDKVIQVGDVFYLCLQGVWFMSTTATGPWTTAPSVPQVIYTIPPSSPVYNVTYVTQVTTSDGNVSSSYTAGYLGAFVMGAAVGAIVASGTGFYYPPYYGVAVVGGYPYYHPYPTAYGYGGYSTAYATSHGAYGVSNTYYGAYGKTTTAAQYNPYTGTSARGVSTSTAYGHQTAAQAYNPYTGSYAATHQGSSPTAQWGQSYVQQGNKSAYAQHYSNAYGTTGSIQGSQGGKAYGTTAGAGNTYAGKTSSGDMYAGHDGNVYQNSGSGWQKYDNGSWNDVNKSSAQQSFNQNRSSGSFDSQSMNSEMQSRASGANQSDRFQQSRSSSDGGGRSWGGGGFGGGGRSWGGGGGGFGGGRSWGGRR